MKLNKCLWVINSLFFVFSLCYYFQEETSAISRGSTWILFLVPVVYALQVRGHRCPAKIRRYGMLYGCFYSIALNLGREIYYHNSALGLYATPRHFLYAVIRIVSFAVVSGYAVSVFYEFIIGAKSNNKHWLSVFPKREIWAFLVLQLIVFLSWLPAFLAYYPGMGMGVYDYASQVNQAIEGFGGYDKHHPPLHTMLIQLAIWIGTNLELAAYTVYGVAQMVFLAAVMARLILFLRKQKAPGWVILCAVLFSTLNPVLAVFSMIPVKDALFGAFFVLLSIRIYELTYDTDLFMKKKRNSILLGVDVLLCCLLRNNMIYAVILSAVVLVLSMKHFRKRAAAILAGTVALYILINDVIYPAMGIGAGNIREMFSVPFQQIANAACREELTETERNYIDTYFGYTEIRGNYNPRNADPVKDLFSNERYKGNEWEFWKGYLSLGKEHPLRYLDAALSLNLPYWYPDADTVDRYSQRAYIETKIGYNEYKNSLMPNVLKKYERVAKFEAFSEKPILENLFSISTPIWLMLLSLLGVLCSDRKRVAPVVVLGIMLWLTYMAGPLSNFRYIFPLFICYPLYLFVLVGNGRENKL